MRRLLLACALGAATAPAIGADVVPAPAAQASAEAVDELLSAMQIDKQYDVVIPQMVNLMVGAFIKGNVGHEEQIRQITSEEMSHAFTAHRKDMIAVTRGVFGRNFSDAEIRDLTAFYKSPTGQKFIAKQGDIVRESMSEGAAIGQAAAKDAIPHILERMRALNLAVPKGA